MKNRMRAACHKKAGIRDQRSAISNQHLIKSLRVVVSFVLIPKSTWIAGRGLRGCRATRRRVAAILSGRGKPRLVRRIALHPETHDSEETRQSRVQSGSLAAVSVTLDPRPSSRPRPAIQLLFGCSSGLGTD